MNYFEELNNFWRLGITSYLTPNANLLYLCLLDMANSRHWPEYIAATSSSLEERTGVEKRDTLYAARARLKQVGLIDFNTKQGTKLATYKILGVENALKVMGLLPDNLPKNWVGTPIGDPLVHPEVTHYSSGIQTPEANGDKASEIPQKKRKRNVIKDKKIYLDFVFLADDEYQKLVEQFGQSKTDEMIERLNSYGHQFPKKFKQYSSHYHTILNWLRKDGETKAGQPKPRGDPPAQSPKEQKKKEFIRSLYT